LLDFLIANILNSFEFNHNNPLAIVTDNEIGNSFPYKITVKENRYLALFFVLNLPFPQGNLKSFLVDRLAKTTS
jgi:hypothetical protein